jgi:hypothetical protein
MPKYLDVSEELRGEVNTFLDAFVKEDDLGRFDPRPTAAVKLGHIINLAIRACPRGVQHTVRRNIVATALKDYCKVDMHECVGDRGTYHKIEIAPK